MPLNPHARSGELLFATRLRRWRQAMQLKQASLGQMLGVSQAAVARWESGADLPGPARITQILDLFRNSASSALSLEENFVRRQHGMSALFELDGMRFVAASRGYARLWPEFSVLTGRFLADHLTETAAELFHTPETHYAMQSGAIGLITGVSQRHTTLGTDGAVHHRWHMQMRRIGALQMLHMVYEPCDAATPIGVEEILNTDALSPGQF